MPQHQATSVSKISKQAKSSFMRELSASKSRQPSRNYPSKKLSPYYQTQNHDSLCNTKNQAFQSPKIKQTQLEMIQENVYKHSPRTPMEFKGRAFPGPSPTANPFSQSGKGQGYQFKTIDSLKTVSATWKQVRPQSPSQLTTLQPFSQRYSCVPKHIKSKVSIPTDLKKAADYLRKKVSNNEKCSIQSKPLPNISVHDKLYQQSFGRAENRWNCREIKNESESEECTFKPTINQREGQSANRRTQYHNPLSIIPPIKVVSINKGKGSGPSSQNRVRTSDEFVSGVDNSQLSRNQRTLDQLRQQDTKIKEDQELKAHCQMKKSSPKLFEKLYSYSRQINLKKIAMAHKIFEENHPFTPTLVSKSKSPLRSFDKSTNLFDDQSMRPSKPSQKEEQIPKALTCSNDKSEEYLTKKYLQGFEEAYQKSECISTIDDLTQFLVELGYLKPNSNQNLKKKAVKLFNVLTDTNRVAASKKNLQSLVLAVHNIKPKLLRGTKQTSVSDNDPYRLGRVDQEGQLVFKNQQVQLVHQTFKTLHEQRCEHLKSLAKQGVKHYKKDLTFKPKICKASRNMVQNSRASFKTETNFTLIGGKKSSNTSQSASYSIESNTDQLFRNSSVRSLKQQEKRESLLNNQLSECTLKPHLTSMTHKRKGSFNSNIEIMTSQPRNYAFKSRERNGKTAEEIEFEKNKDQCTFKPNLSKVSSKKVISEKKSSLSQSQYGKKVVNWQPRKSQKEKYALNCSATASNTSSQTGASSSGGLNDKEAEKHSEEPIMFANVHIGRGNATARLVLFEGEDVQEVVATFCLKYSKLYKPPNSQYLGLNEEVSRKLLKLITSQLSAQ